VEDQTSLLQGSMQEDSFEVVMRGYNKRQVDDYALQCQHHIRDLAQRLALAEQEIERVRVEASAALEKAASKPVHEEVSERLAQILRLANEEAERERAVAAEEIAELRAKTLSDTQALREQAQRESEALRQLAVADTEAQRSQVAAETEALRERVGQEAEALREHAEQDAQAEGERAQLEAERVLSAARDAAERDVAQAHAAAIEVEQGARGESERLMLAAQERSETLIGEAERRANAINTVLGSRLEVLTTTHEDVVGRLSQLRTTLLDVLGAEEALGAFEVPLSPAEAAARSTAAAQLGADPLVQTAGEVAAAYEASVRATPAATGSGPTAFGGSESSLFVPAPAGDAGAAEAAPGHLVGDDAAAPPAEDGVELDDAPPATPAGPARASGRRLDLTSVPDKTRH
jgi:chromosome segregation ATPase